MAYVVARLGREASIRGLVLASGKPDALIEGMYEAAEKTHVA